VRSGDMFCAGLIHLSDGRVLIVGGTENYYATGGWGGLFTGRRTSVIYDWKKKPKENPWVTNVPEMQDGRWYPTLLRLYNGQIAVVSGIKHDDKNLNSPLVEFYEPEANRWTSIDMGEIDHSPLTSLASRMSGTTDRIHHYPRLFPLPDGRILFSHDGSGMGNMLSKNTYILKLAFGESGTAPKASFSLGPERPVTNKVYSGGMIDPIRGDLLLSGGQSGVPGLSGPGSYAIQGASIVADLERLSIDAQGRGHWQRTQNFFGLAEKGPRVMHNMIALPTGQVLVIGGGNYAYHRPIFEPLLLTDCQSTPGCPPGGFLKKLMAPGLQPRLYHNTALLLPDSSIFVAGGNPSQALRKPDGSVVLATHLTSAGLTRNEPGQEFHSAEIWQAEIYYPHYWSNNPPQIVEAPETLIYGHPAALKVENTEPGGSISLVSLGAPTHGFDSGQRFASLDISKRRRASESEALKITFKAPDNRFLYPPGYYMLFFVDPSGTPSHAEFVQLKNPSSESTQP